MSATTYTFNVAMTCDGCANQVKRVVGKLGDKVAALDIDVTSRTVKITSTLSREELLETLKKTGIECS